MTPEILTPDSAAPPPVAPPVTRPTDPYVGKMRLLGLSYLAGAALFFFFPKELIYALNIVPKVFNITEAVPDPTDRFWPVYAGTLAVVLCSLSFLSAESPKTRGYALTHILAKVVLAAGFGLLYAYDKPYFIYLIGIAIEVPLALWLAWTLVRRPA